MKLTKSLKSAIIAHALDCYPAECCGVIVNGNYIPCVNTAVDNEQFTICPKDFAKAESFGKIQAIVHSHPDGGVLPSDLDKLQIELHGLPWVIVAVSKHEYGEKPSFGLYQPCGYKPPLLGRNYIHGVQDCYAIVRDFYEREFGILLLEFERTDAWWEDPMHLPLYEQNFENAGFLAVDKHHLQYGDILLCRVGRTHHVNHALIWLGNNGVLTSEMTPPCVGNTLILHHPYGRQSVREIYGKQWADRTVLAVRHHSRQGV
ncbi:putative metal-dependent protease of the PAD1/JAB1 superfamily protein [Moraxella macacae 0408225]|uniref:Putative metal-dependent protease of the PAD1/JAB1 superfamily protein n=1 Tax=Moraxella macacae 0408225 TaxID=1230338 RepID=L2F741_9GAMM|nr:C40 family peptidase [Moraxella macacae]ELA08720.1 putative metal-dependent protease of the PAD1/JAB1 superfamily protein [Moraxella macacae 0408225]